MGLVPAKCTSCCGTLEVDAELKAAICPHCGSAYIVQEAINQYNITNVYKINNANFTVDHRKIFSDRIVAAEKQLRFLKDYPKALNSFMALQNDVPEEFRIWSGMLEARSKGYDVVATSNLYLSDEQYLYYLGKDYENAYMTADDEQKKDINQKFVDLLKQCFDRIKAVDVLLTKNSKKREKAQRGAEVFGKIGVVFLVLLIILFILALAISGIPFLLFLSFGVVDEEFGLQYLMFTGLTFLPALFVLAGVIILMCIGKRYEKKYQTISQNTTKILTEQIGIELPDYNECAEYYSQILFCRRKIAILSDYIKKYKVNDG